MLVPVDFSDSSGPALAVADALAALYDARVDALHAAYVPDLPDIYGLGLHFEATYPQIVSRVRRRSGRPVLARFVAPGTAGRRSSRSARPSRRSWRPPATTRSASS